MRPAVFTDEIDLDAVAAIRVCAAEGVRAVQLRRIGQQGHNVVALPDDEIRALLAALRDNDVRAVGIGSPFGKCDLFDDAAYERHLALLARAIELAHLFDAPLIRVFAFNPPPQASLPFAAALDRIAERLAGPADLARREGVTLALENEYTTLVGSCREVRQVVEAVGSQHLRVCWDVASGWYTGESILPDGYEQVRGVLCDVHVRDATADPADPTRHGTVCRLGEGAIDWPGVIERLSTDGYDSYITVETHLHWDEPPGGPRRREATVHGLRLLRQLLR
jgi:sugar phosphate isomerase/epimerase